LYHYRITKSDQDIALSSLKLISKREEEASKKKLNVVTLTIQGSDELVTIPLKALKLLKAIISNMAEGKSIALLPTDAEITTQQAAEMLNVSRPHIIKLLEKGDIPFKKVGSHRRILLQDMLAYEATFKKKRRKQLNALSKEAQKLNLGY